MKWADDACWLDFWLYLDLLLILSLGADSFRLWINTIQFYRNSILVSYKNMMIYLLFDP